MFQNGLEGKNDLVVRLAGHAFFRDGFYRFSFTPHILFIGSFKQPKKPFLKAFSGFQLIVNIRLSTFLIPSSDFSLDTCGNINLRSKIFTPVFYTLTTLIEGRLCR